MNEEDQIYYTEYSKTPLIDRFIHAIRGIVTAWKTEANFKIEALIALLVLGAMFILPLTNIERSVLILIITLVLALEIINSIFERVLNLIHPKFSSEVKKIKDTMAGIVFLASLSSVIIGLFILARPLSRFDLFVQANFESFRTESWLKIAGLVTTIANWETIVALTIIFSLGLLFKKRYECLSFLLGAVGIGEVFLFLLKWFFGRERPADVHFSGPQDYSFPSGHVFVATVFFLAVAVILNILLKQRRYLWAIAAVVIILVALSRVVLSVHWFSDILGGFIFGVFWLLLWYGINHKFWLLRKNLKIGNTKTGRE